MGAGAQRSAREVPMACTLGGREQRERREELARDIFSGRLATEELDDGYVFVFPGEAAWAERLVEFVVFERVCCPFFSFELLFGPDGGPISLGVRGPEGAKEFAREEFADA